MRGQWICELDGLSFAFLRATPFARDHPDHATLARLCREDDCEVELVCFLLERGYVELYAEIQTSLHHRLHDLPIHVRNRFEACYLRYVAAQSNEAFLEDHSNRERGESGARRMDEIIQAYPLRHASQDLMAKCAKCVICQFDIRRRQHVRQTCATCVYHRRCADAFLLRSRACAICRRVLIVDT